MKRFLEYLQNLNESPQKMEGDAPFEEVSYNMIQSKSKRVLGLDFDLYQKDFIVLKSGEKLDLYKSKVHNYFLLGRFYKEQEDEIRFAVIFDLSFKIEKYKSKQKQLNGKEVITIETVHTARDYRGSKIAQQIYRMLLNKYIIMSDSIQYEGAVNLWKVIIKNSTVYSYNILEDKIISKITSNTPDTQVWSDNESKRRIRLVAI